MSKLLIINVKNYLLFMSKIMKCQKLYNVKINNCYQKTHLNYKIPYLITNPLT